MKNKKFLYSMNNISDSAFDKYYNYESRLYQAQAFRKRKFMKTCALAACLTVCVCICIAFMLPAFMPEKHPPHDGVTSPPGTFEETQNENAIPFETDEENEQTVETSEESEHVHDENCGCFTGETAVVTQEEATSKVTEDDTSFEGTGTTEECTHNWECVSSNNDEYKCSNCNKTHLCVDPKDWDRDGNYNPSTAIYKCRICGTKHYTTDPDYINKEDSTEDVTE